ncbi:hypothetical protein FO440_05885 [Mucilaginibacter corticis]|uniref:Uncharacterized protein n=1 Tax=Mucilaginibacter corticis TaxID=2597670 RepID=A0A556MV97_9SPHI|nr:hypothetical protein [Mucilaginibacter corticis]TSJ43719.1 hypothetical protein FO440_05885 [Mucilaginibacter corticis]
MKIETIDHLAYIIKEAEKRGRPKPIVFLGAGASRSAGIPDAKTIAKTIITDYPSNPKIKKLKEEERTYSRLMDTLQPSERNELLKSLIDKAKINVTHVYLAQMMKLGFIDYFLTVNFDNLMQRALALYNIFPPTYDISILKDITTTSFHPKSITYLHGQHNGLWLLNTKDEMEKVKEIVPPILNKISNGRIWIIIGYSGGDPIFDHIVNLGRFDDGLYWVGYKENDPADNVIKDLLDKSNTNSFLIKDYDADSFCLKLNTELGNPEPSIFDQPFSFLKSSLDNIVDIENTETYKSVRERLDDSKKMVEDAIQKYEGKNQSIKEMTDRDIRKSKLKKSLINALIKNDYENNDDLFTEGITLNDAEINELLSRLYNDWGARLHSKARNSQGLDQKKYFEMAVKKFEKAIDLNKDDFFILNNWGSALGDFASILTGTKQINFYKSSFEKFEKATALDDLYEEAYLNWGSTLTEYAKKLSGSEEELYYNLSFEKFAKVESINNENQNLYSNWSYALICYSYSLKNEKRILYLNEALEKAKRAVELGDNEYNVACAYALLGEKNNALRFLELTLKNRSTSTKEVLADRDWSKFAEDDDLIRLLSKYN